MNSVIHCLLRSVIRYGFHADILTIVGAVLAANGVGAALAANAVGAALAAKGSDEFQFIRG